MRVFAAENGADLSRLALIIKRFQIMCNRHQIRFRRQFHSRVPPVTGREDAETTGFNKRFQFGLNRFELGFAVAGPVGNALRQLGGFLRIGLQGRDYIDPVKRRQMIEVDDMILHRMLGHDHVADILGVERHFHIQSVFHRTDRRDRMYRGADAAETLGIDPGILRRTSLQNRLNTAPHLRRRPGVSDSAAIYFHINSQVTFDTGDRVKGYTSHYCYLRIFLND